MSAWEKAEVCGIYTVSPLHVSTGQAEGAIDLPVTKEPHTGFPVIPASSLKGVARDALAYSVPRDAPTRADVEKEVEAIFGPTLKKTDERNRQEAAKSRESPPDAAQPEVTKPEGTKPEAARTGGAAEKLFTGALVFTEARLVACAARSLNRPFLHVTCRLVLERLARDLRAAGIGDLGSLSLPSGGARVLVADGPLAKSTLVLEDLVYKGEELAQSSDLARIARALASLIPAGETDTRSRLEKGLVFLPDEDFSMLVRRLPVRARIRLDDDNKTTSGEDGNLWYEEQVPADCLFVSMIGARRNKTHLLEAFQSKARACLEVTQIGGNETVGEGICFWTVGPQRAEEGAA